MSHSEEAAMTATTRVILAAGATASVWALSADVSAQ
jgi:hypothetical protein